MRKITDGYARQTLKSTLGDGPFKPEWIRVKKSILHLGRVIRFKRKEIEHKLEPSQKPLAEQAYSDAREFMNSKKK